MLNTIQPFVNLTNASLHATSKFFQAPELAEMSKTNTERFGKVAEESFAQLAESDAVRRLSREMIQNFSRFTNECVQNYFSLMTQVPSSMANQVQDFSRQIEKGIGQGIHSAERIGENAEEAEEGMKGKSRANRQAA